MAFRGRGRGRGYGGGIGFRAAKQEPFVLFPEIKELGNAESVTEQMALVMWSSKLQKFLSSSVYYIEDKDEGPKKKESTEVERFSDKALKKTGTDQKLEHFVEMSMEYFPSELIEGKRNSHGRKKVRWNPESGLQKLDFFEKLEQKYQGQEEKGEKEKKEGEDEEEDDERIEEEDEELSDDGDYNQNIDFDDDEDDFNMDDDNGDEAIY